MVAKKSVKKRFIRLFGNELYHEIDRISDDRRFIRTKCENVLRSDMTELYNKQPKSSEYEFCYYCEKSEKVKL
jgi:hypothetical protein